MHTHSSSRLLSLIGLLGLGLVLFQLQLTFERGTRVSMGGGIAYGYESICWSCTTGTCVSATYGVQSCTGMLFASQSLCQASPSCASSSSASSAPGMVTCWSCNSNACTSTISMGSCPGTHYSTQSDCQASCYSGSHFCCDDTEKSCTGKFLSGAACVSGLRAAVSNKASCAENPCDFPGVENTVKEKQKTTQPPEYSRTAPTWNFTFEDTSPTASSANSRTRSPLCGNKKIDPGEDCDLGITNNGKGICSEDCRSYYCTDGIVSRQVGEECEPTVRERKTVIVDGQSITTVTYVEEICGKTCMVPTKSDEETGRPLDGCIWKFLPLCKPESALEQPVQSVEPASSAPSDAAPIVPVSAPQVCGNGAQEGDEQCDHGTSNSDITANECRTTCMLPSCGDGVVDSIFGENCDQGLSNSNERADACRTSCQRARCGDGVKDRDEECDGGVLCSSNCTNIQPFVPSQGSVCGNAVVEEGERCDDGNKASRDGCSATCTLERSICGNGVIEEREQCDDGNTNYNDGCSSSCKREVDSCGNGILQEGEECDLGWFNSDSVADRCRSTCRNAGCGDAVRDEGEECDDGNGENDDICTTACKFPTCGDGFVQMVEECDDGNTRNADGCSASCTVEATHSAAGASGSVAGDVKSIILILFGSLIGFGAGFTLQRKFFR